MIDKIFEIKNKDLKITKVGFIEDQELDIKINSQFGVYPIYKIHINSEDKLKKILNDTKVEEYLYDITLNDLIIYIENKNEFKQFLKERYLNSIELFKEGVDIWINSVFENLKYTILEQNENEIMFYIY